MTPEKRNKNLYMVNWCYFCFIFQSHAFCGSWLKWLWSEGPSGDSRVRAGQEEAVCGGECRRLRWSWSTWSSRMGSASSSGLRLHDNGGKWGRGASSHCHLLTREIRSEEEKSDVVWSSFWLKTLLPSLITGCSPASCCPMSPGVQPGQAALRAVWRGHRVPHHPQTRGRASVTGESIHVLSPNYI